MKSRTIPQLHKEHADAITTALGEALPFAFQESVPQGFEGYAVVTPNNVIGAIKNAKSGAVYGRLSIAFAKRNFDIFFGAKSKVKSIIVLGDKVRSDQMCWFCLAKAKTTGLVERSVLVQKGAAKRIGRPPKEKKEKQDEHAGEEGTGAEEQGEG